MTIWNKNFWKAVAERAIATFAQAFIAAVGVEAVGFGDVDWPTVLSISGVAALLSVVKSLAINKLTETGPSAIKNEIVVSDATVAQIDYLDATD